MALQKNVRDGQAVVNGMAVRYYDSGPNPRSKETIVLLHGTGGSAESNFWALFPMLAMRHRVIALDFVDADDAAPCQAEHYVRQVLAVVKAIPEAGVVHLVGYSFGAVIAAEFAARHGVLLRSLTLVAGWVKTDTHQKLRNHVWRGLYTERSAALAEFSVFVNFSQSFLNSKNSAELEALKQAIASGPDRSKKMAFNREVDITHLLGEILVPCLVIGCTQDQTAPIRHSKLLFGGLKDSRFAAINSGHGVVHERPAELFSMIDRFVSDVHAMAAGYVIENGHA